MRPLIRVSFEPISLTLYARMGKILFCRNKSRDLTRLWAQGAGAISFDGAPSSRLLIERSILEANAVRVRQSDEADTPATVVVFTGGLGDGSQDALGAYHAPVWRIDDGRKCSGSLCVFFRALTEAAAQLFTACNGSFARPLDSTRWRLLPKASRQYGRAI